MNFEEQDSNKRCVKSPFEISLIRKSNETETSHSWTKPKPKSIKAKHRTDISPLSRPRTCERTGGERPRKLSAIGLRGRHFCLSKRERKRKLFAFGRAWHPAWTCVRWPRCLSSAAAPMQTSLRRFAAGSRMDRTWHNWGKSGREFHFRRHPLWACLNHEVRPH